VPDEDGAFDPSPNGGFSLRATPASARPEFARRKPVAPIASPLTTRTGVMNAANSTAGLYSRRITNEPPPPYAEQSAPYPEEEPFPDATNWLPGARQNPRKLPSLPSPTPDRPGPSATRVNATPYVTSSSVLRQQAGASGLDLPQANQVTASSTGTRLTLIRRDPATGEQWNVAHIEDPTEVQKSPSGRRSVKTHGLPISIAVETPGYTKFMRDPWQPDVPPPAGRESTTVSPESSREIPAFIRRLALEDSRILPFHKKSSSSGVITRKPVGAGYDASRGNSDSGFPHSPSMMSLAPIGNEIEGQGRNSKSKSYSFESPWAGRCEFSAAIGSSSLKVSIGPAGQPNHQANVL
jgi:hypothetical protein